jgi:hypothetical protein
VQTRRIPALVVLACLAVIDAAYAQSRWDLEVRSGALLPCGQIPTKQTVSYWIGAGAGYRANRLLRIRYDGGWVFMTDADGNPRPRNWMIMFLEAGFRYRL